MNRWHLYGVTDSPGQLVDEVTFLHEGSLFAAVGKPLDLNVAGLLLHQATLEKLGMGRSFLPARFGPPRVEAAIRGSLQRRGGLLRDALGDLAGKLEVGLRFWVRAGEVGPAPTQGSAYLRWKLENRRHQRSLLQGAARTVLATLPSQQLLKFISEPQPTGVASFLLSRVQVTVLQEAVSKLQANFPLFSFVLTGPWPPYSFAPAILEDFEEMPV